MRGSESPERAPGSSAVAAAVVFALIVVALSGSQPMANGHGEANLRPALSDSSRARMVAAAVRAARDLLGVDRPTEVLLRASDSHIRVQLSSGCLDRSWENRWSELDRLGPRATDLPPPIC